MPARPDGFASFDTGGISLHGVRADPTDIADVRDLVRRWLEGLHLAAERRHDVVLASYEALANAVEHAYAAGDEAATVDFTAVYQPVDRQLEITVVDHGRWRTERAGDADSSRGHGLTLIRALTTETVVTLRPDGTHVAMRWLL